MSNHNAHGKTRPANSAHTLLAQIGQARLTPQTKEEAALPKIWDELNAIYQNCQQGLQIYATIKDMRGRTDLLGAMTPAQRATYVSLATRLANDLGAYDRDLQTIYALHAGKTGGEADLDAAKVWIQITEQYENFKVQAESVLSQTYLHLTEVIQAAEVQLAAVSDAGNPDIITDVVVTEESEEVSS